MKTRSPPPSLSFKGQATKQGPVNGSIVNVMLILLSSFFLFLFFVFVHTTGLPCTQLHSMIKWNVFSFFCREEAT